MQPDSSRRRFLQGALAAGACLAAGTDAAGEESRSMPDLPIVDTHQHLWDLQRFRLPWTKNAPALARSFVMSDYLAASAGLGIVKTVYMEVDVEAAQQEAEAQYVIDLCQRDDNPMVAAVISGRPASPGFGGRARKYRDHPHLKGFRQVLHVAETPKGYFLDKEFVAGIRLLGDCALSFDLCVRPEELPDAARLVDSCPATQFILDHCGNVRAADKDRSAWQRDIAQLARRENVAVKISGQIDKAPANWTADDLAPIIEHTCEVFGPERVMFGSDWPVCTLGGSLRSWVEALRAITASWSHERRRKLFHDNAVRIYRLAG